MSEHMKLGRQTPVLSVGEDEGLGSFYDLEHVRNRIGQMGSKLLPWQEHMVRESLKVRDGQFYYKNIGLSVPRQNGKTEIIVMRAMIGLIFLSDEMMYTSYRYESADAIYNRMIDVIEASPRAIKAYFPQEFSRKTKDKKIEAFDPTTNKRLGYLRFMTRKGGGGRGLTEKIIFIDEAQDLTAAENDAITGSTATFKNGQVWYVGTPETASAATKGMSASGQSETFFGSIRSSIMKRETAKSYWAEWSVAKVTSKNDVSAWYQANPSLGYSFGEGRGITEDYLGSRVMDEMSFAIEHLGYWSSQSRSAAIDRGRWEDLKLDYSGAALFKGGKVTLALKSDVADRTLELVTATRKKGSQEVYVEEVSYLDMDTNWEPQVWPILDKYLRSGMCRSIIIDGDGAKNRLIPLLIQKGRWRQNGHRFRQGKVSIAQVTDLVSGCAQLVAGVTSKSIAHGDQPRLTSAVIDAERRPMRNKQGFGFQSITGKTNPALVEAVALAVGESLSQRIESDSEPTALGNTSSMGQATRL